MQCGAWNYADMPACNLPEKAATAFSKAITGLVGVKYTPVLYVGSQLVSGTNYCIICKTVTVTQEPIEGCVSMIIYEDLQGNVAITSITHIIK